MARHKKKKRIKGRFYVFCLILILIIGLAGYFGIKALFGDQEGGPSGTDELASEGEIQASQQDDGAVAEPETPPEPEKKKPEIPLVTSADGTPAASTATLANTESYYEGAVVIANPNDYHCIVNRKYNLPSDYEPDDLVKVSIPFAQRSEEVKYMRKDANDALNEMFAAAKEEAGFELYGASGYRSYNIQKSLFSGNAQRKGSIAEANKTSALPGQSEHQLGLAMDITSESMNFTLSDSFYDTPEGKWVTDNCHRFGFIIRYPANKEAITGYMYEPWHCRYVGKELAEELHSSGLTMEEYYGVV